MASTLNASAKTQLLDVRTQGEWNEKHLEKAQLIDFNAPDFKDKVSKLNKDDSYELFCRSGNRSGQATKIMTDLGFKNVKNLGSLEDAAKAKGLPCVGPGCEKN